MYMSMFCYKGIAIFHACCLDAAIVNTMHLNKICLIALLVTMLCSTATAQELSMNDLIIMRTMPMTSIDSLVKEREFVKSKVEQDSGFALTKYTCLIRTNNALHQRNFIVRIKADEYTELQYEVYQQEDADKYIKWLTDNGYKKKVSKLSSRNNETGLEFIEYRKKKDIVGYEENRYSGVDEKQKVYIFSVINTEAP